MNKILFLDRDGVINKKAPPHQHITSVDDFIILPKVYEALDYARSQGYKIIILTNQRMVQSSIYQSIHEHMMAALPQIDAVYVCPHDYDSCECRKPLPGLFYQAELDYNIDKEKSIMIGDSDTDIQAGESYGVRSYLTTNLYETVKEYL